MRPLVLACALAAAAPGARAEDLLQVYRDARGYDAPYAAARYQLEAGKEKLPQGRALVLPTIGLSANSTQSRLEFESDNTALSPSFQRDLRTSGYVLSFSQPLYRAQNFLQYDQAEFQVKQAEAVFSQATQDLILRVSQAYFDALAAEDNLQLVRAQKAAIAEQLAQAKRNFEVGTATITDTHEAQARFDLVGAQEIVAQNAIDQSRRALQQITGKEYASLLNAQPDVKLGRPNPDNMQSWVELAEKQSYPVLIQETTVEIAQLEARRNRAGHYPTLDFVASYGQSSQNATETSPVGGTRNAGAVGLQLAIPLYQGGGISAREREAAALAERSKQDLENARRSAALASRQSYLLVVNGLATIGALEQALVSSSSALASNKLGYEVGVRINIDVLNAQQQVFTTRRDLLLARYNTIMSHLRLKAAAGSLTEQDVEEINRVLTAR